MSKLRGVPLRTCLQVGALLIAGSLPVLADTEAECRQEAEDYGIPPEQMGDYIDGCVLSRGGSYGSEAPVADYNPPAESDENLDTGQADSDVPQ